MGRDLAADRARVYGAMRPGGDKSVWHWYRIQLFDPEFHCVAAYRFGQFARHVRRRHRVLGVVLAALHRMANRFVNQVHHMEISPRATIGPGLRLMHRHGVLIGPARIGKHCTLHHGITIGERVAKRDHGIPEIGDNVWIGPGVIITGAVHIGNGVTISAGSVLSKDIPDTCLVAGNPARIVTFGYDNTELLGVPDGA
ncbi:MAG: serine acetyltransferase [Propionibacterium sp.]|nr:serine acetyltransferase [Propionibacterium sp.]